MTEYGMYMVWLGVVVQLLGSAAYIRDTLRGVTKPNRVTWFFWMLAPFIGTSAALSDGAGWAVLPVFMVGLMPMFVLVASFVNKNAYWQLGRFDYVCGALAALALGLWATTREPVVAVVFAVAADASAALPTFSKAWTHPDTETAAEYAATVFSALTGFLVMKTWSISEFAFPLWLVLLNSAVLFILYRRKLRFRLAPWSVLVLAYWFWWLWITF